MKRKLGGAAIAAALALALAVPPAAWAAEEKVNGVVTQIDVAKDKKSAVATVKDDETAALVPITIVDAGTLQKLERAIIQVGDEIKCKYEKKGKKKVATTFRKAAGCSG